MNKFRIPEGSRDLIPIDCKKKRKIEKQIEDTFISWGYEEVSTPSLEYYSCLLLNIDDKKSFKLIEEDSNVLALRSDMTVPIGRVVCTKLKNRSYPLRLRYKANVFSRREKYDGKPIEWTDCGAELIGIGGIKADVEILLLALETMDFSTPLEYIMEIGDIRFFDYAVENEKFSKKDLDKLKKLISEKSVPDLKIFLENLNINEELKNFLLKLPKLWGDKKILDVAKNLCMNEKMEEAVSYLSEIFEILEELGYGDKIFIDFSKLNKKSYYTGIIFEVFVKGVGSGVISGGRYDKLLETFGKGHKAGGFSVKTDLLIDVFQEEDILTDEFVLKYPENQLVNAFKTAKKLRDSGKIVIMEKSDIEEISWGV